MEYSEDKNLEEELKENYPDRLIRGILNESYMLNNLPAAKIYRDNSVDSIKCIGHKEYSINWYDNTEALKMILEEHKEEGQLKYKEGAAILSRNKVKEIQRQYQIHDKFKYNRDPIEDPVKGDNIYHGNLLVRADFYPIYKDMIPALLAYHSIRVRSIEEAEDCDL